jgi:hypothetical protein
MPSPKFRVRADQCGPSKKLKPWMPDRTLVGTGRKVFIPSPAMALDMKRFGSGSSAVKTGGGKTRRNTEVLVRKNRRRTFRKIRYSS